MNLMHRFGLGLARNLGVFAHHALSRPESADRANHRHDQHLVPLPIDKLVREHQHSGDLADYVNFGNAITVDFRRVSEIEQVRHEVSPVCPLHSAGYWARTQYAVR